MTDVDALIVGGGSAALAAAAWLDDLKVAHCWWAEAWGSDTLARVGNAITTYPGVDPVPGRELGELLRGWSDRAGRRPETGLRVEHCGPGERGRWRVIATQDDGAERVATPRAVVLATGTAPRMLGLPHERELLGQGVELSVTRRRHEYRGARCVIVGGGDAALEGALLLAEVDASIVLVHRGAALAGQRRFEEAVLASPRIDVRLQETVVGLHVDAGRLTGVALGGGEHIEATGLFQRIGVAPRLPAGLPAAAIGHNGYLTVDATGRSPIDGLYGAGDVCSPIHQSVAWSVGLAARATAAVREDLGY